MTDLSHPSAASRQTPNGEAGTLDAKEIVRRLEDGICPLHGTADCDDGNDDNECQRWSRLLASLTYDLDEALRALASRSADAVPPEREAQDEPATLHEAVAELAEWVAALAESSGWANATAVQAEINALADRVRALAAAVPVPGDGGEDEADNLRAIVGLLANHLSDMDERGDSLNDQNEVRRAMEWVESRAARLSSVGASEPTDTEILDWMDEHSAEVTVADDECGSVTVQSNTDYRVTGHASGYDIRGAVRDAKRVAAALSQEARPHE